MKEQFIFNIFEKYQIYICITIGNIYFRLFWIVKYILRPPEIIYLLVSKVTKSTICVMYFIVLMNTKNNDIESHGPSIVHLHVHERKF